MWIFDQVLLEASEMANYDHFVKIEFDSLILWVFYGKKQTYGFATV